MSVTSRSLKELAKLRSGGTPSKKNPAFWGGEIPWLTPKDMAAFDGKTVDCVNMSAIGNGTRLAPKTALFIAVRGMSLHNEIRIVRPEKEMTFNQDIKSIVPNSEVDSRFLFYALKNQIPKLLTQVHAAGHGTGVLSTDILNATLIPFFGRSEQDRIGSILADFDEKIDLNRRMNETLEEMARALFRDWFVDFGPTRRQLAGEVDPATIMGNAFPSEKAKTLAPHFPASLGENGLPERWKRVPVGDVSDIVGGGTPNTKTESFWKNGSHLWATPRDLSKLSGVFVRETERKLTDAGLAKVSSGLCPVGSILMSSRAPIGYLAIAHKPLAVNQGFIVMRPSDRFPTYFAKLWCEENMHTIEANANGSTFQEISKKNFKPIKVILPDEGTMSVFSDFAENLFRMISNNEEENQTLAALRDLLLPKLMSGKIRLKDAEAMV